MKNSKSIVSMLIVLCMVLAFTACNNGSLDIAKSYRSNGGSDGGDTGILASIAVAGNLSGPFYFADDDLSSSLTVTATYSDREPRTVTGFTHDLATKIGLNRTSVTISYTEGGITKTAEVSGTFHVARAEARPTETPVKLSGYTGTLFDGTSDKGTYYIFGDFPQTVAPSENTYTSVPVYNGYYLGSDGYFYAKCPENACEKGYTYDDGTSVGQSSERYFKVEPIKWRVLNTKESGNKILLAESILTANIPWYGSTDERTLNGSDTISLNNYEHSNIRAYLNGISYQSETGTDNTWENSGFLQIAFTESAQALILTTDVDNSEASTNPDKATQEHLESWWNGGKNPYVCKNTTDKIFLLSEKEASTKDYGFTAYDVYDSGNIRIMKTTDYALANYAWKSNTAGYGGLWWLRSPSYGSSNRARIILYNGMAYNENHVNSENGGVVPALSISASSLQ